MHPLPGLSIPLVTEGHNLIRKLRKVFIRPAFIMMDNPKQTLSGTEQAHVNRSYFLLGNGRLNHRNTCFFTNPGILCQIKD